MIIKQLEKKIRDKGENRCSPSGVEGSLCGSGKPVFVDINN